MQAGLSANQSVRTILVILLSIDGLTAEERTVEYCYSVYLLYYIYSMKCQAFVFFNFTNK